MAEIDGALRTGETRADLMRTATMDEIDRRKAGKLRKVKKQ